MWQNPALFPAVTNRESVALSFSLYDDDTGELLDLTGMTFAFEVRRPIPGMGGVIGGGYSPYHDIGNYDNQGPVLSLSLGSGITVPSTGVVQVDITAAQMRVLVPSVYEVGFTVTSEDGLDTRQILLGKLPVLFGGVT